MRQTIRLTESELRNLIEESVNEAMMNEGVGGAMNALGGWMKNKVGQASQSMMNGAKQMGQKAINYGKNKAQQVKQGYGELKKTAQVGSNNQEAQKAINNAVNALENLLAVDQKMETLGGSVIGNGSQRQTIINCIKTLNGGATSIGSRFQSRRDARTKPGAKFTYESKIKKY